MAEVYGEKPKIFTRGWWPYFWMYYKWHTLGILFVAVLVIVFGAQCINKTKYDLIVTYAGGAGWTNGAAEKLASELSEAVVDIDGNGEKNVLVETIILDSTGADAQMTYDMQLKIDIEMSQEEYNLYLLDAAETELMIGREEANLVFSPVSDWAEGEYPEEQLYIKDGTAYAVSVEGNEYLENLGIPTKGIYMLVRSRDGGSEAAVKSREGAVAAANLILK